MKTHPFLAAVTLLLGAGLALLTGCSSVSVPAPVGEKPHVLHAPDWAGTWLSDDGKAVSVVLSDASKGELRMFGLEINEGAAALMTYSIHVRESAGWLFASLRDEGGQPNARYLWARLSRVDDVILIWAPEPKAFAALVREGKLKGRVQDSGDVELEPMPAEALQALAAGAFGVPFEWDTPVVLRRVGR